MKEYIFSLLRVPTADVLAVRELEEAKRELLRSQSAQDYAKRMVEYHQDRVKRLTAYISKEQACSN
jgi:predicted outer membrane protein